MELNDLVTQIQRTHEEFKSYVDRELKEVRANGGAAPETKEALDKLNNRLDELQAKISNPARTQDTGGINLAERKEMADWARGKAMSVGSDPDGGYTVKPDTTGRIVAKIYDTTPMRQICNVATISTSDAYEGLIDNDEVSAGWVGERGTRSETDTPVLGKYRITPEEIYAEPQITQKLLDDSALDIGAWLEMKIGDLIGRTQNAAFITGNGIIKPRGFTTYTTAATADSTRAWGVIEHVATANNGDFPASTPGDTLHDTIYKLKAAYRQGASWMMPKAALGKIRKFKEATTNAYMWQPGLQANQPNLLLGYPVIESEDMPALATDSLSVAFGNFREAYTIVDRQGIRMIRDSLTAKGYVKFYTTARVGGAVVNFEAIKLVKFGS
jgi:HK97 family phage major capsid protein